MRSLISVLFVLSTLSSLDAADAARVAIEYSEAIERNDAELTRWVWQNKIYVHVDGQEQWLKYHEVTGRPDGRWEMKTLTGKDAAHPEAGLETAVGKELAGQVLTELRRYLHPRTGALVDFFGAAEFSADARGRLKIQGRGFFNEEDSVTLVLDYNDRRPHLFEIETVVDGNPVRARLQYEVPENAPFFPHTIDIEFPEQKVTAQVRSFYFKPKTPPETSVSSVPEDDGWPKIVAKGGHVLMIFQPQVQNWENYQSLEASVAVSLRRQDDHAAQIAAVELVAETHTDLAARTVLVSRIRVTKAHFPGLDAAESKDADLLLRSLFPRQETVPIDLDRVLASLDRSQIDSRQVEVSFDPPRIIASNRHAVLVTLDGEPQLEAVEGTDLMATINTSADLYLHMGSSRYYLRDENAWMMTPDLAAGPWSPAPSLPEDFEKIADGSEELKSAIPGRVLPANQAPAVFVSQEPAELLVVYGEPELEPIPGTRLVYVTNTECDLFLHYGDHYYYFLTAGRWFRALELRGPWEAATFDLPSDFARIPTAHSRARVLVSVEGTTEAEEAAILAEIPQAASVNRSDVKVEVTYVGEPVWKVIEGTPIETAVNTSQDVFRIDQRYYLCESGVWFVSDTPRGPWVVCDDVPDIVYAIPSSSSKHRVTYVHVYGSDPESVQVGYTPGYLGVYVAAGLVVWGTAYHYHHHHDYYVHYHGRYGHGHYQAGYGYFGPNHTYGYGARYDYQNGGYQATRGYARTYGGAAATRQVSTPYGSWGRSVAVRGDQWVQTAHRSTAGGSAAGFRTSGGARGVVVQGPDGTGGVVKTRNNNLYVGKDGEVYRRNNGKWETYSRGQGWGSAENRSGDRASSRAERRTAGAGARPSTGRGGARASTRRGLDREHRARKSGSSRSEHYRSQRSSNRTKSGGGRRSSGGRRGGGRR